jgi:hypothetical protein
MSAVYVDPAPVVRRTRGYFAPVNRAVGTPSVFDPAELGGFALDAPPVPWVSLGWVRNFVRKAGSRTVPVLTGVPAAVLEQVRETAEAQVSFEFLSWTKLTMGLAAGSQSLNLLMPAGGASASADGAVAASAVTILSGATATMLPMAATDAAKFTAGQLVVVDVDYAGQVGFVGSPVAGAYVKAGAVTDVDYVRRVTWNVARIAASSAAGLTLAEALPSGAPTAGMKAQAATGFLDREGGSFFQEWSGLFVQEGGQGERIVYYYPRLQSLGSAAEVGSLIDAKSGSSLERVGLAGVFRALPVTDSLDEERVVCYRSYMPAGMAVV